MPCFRWGLVALICLTLFDPALAQNQKRRRGFPGGGLQRRFAENAPDVDELLPDLSGFDAEGQRVKLRDLKGKHTVLVFGCLT